MATTVEEKAPPAAGVAPVIEQPDAVATTAPINQFVLSATFQGLKKGVMKKKYSGQAARIMAGARPRKHYRKNYKRAYPSFKRTFSRGRRFFRRY